MNKITAQDLANMINEDCNNFKYFYAFGLLQETRNVWNGDNKSMLCDTAQIMLEQIEEE
jgi:hypothetical protein